MVLMIIRIVAVFVLLFGFVYGLITHKFNKFPPFYNCALFSVICAFMAYLYYLALSTDSELDAAFTVGIFGEAAQFSFILTANIRYMEEDSFNKKFNIKALLLSLLLVIPQIIYIIFAFSIGNLACVIIYICTVGPCGYFCISNMIDRKNYPFRKVTFRYNLFSYLMLLSGALSQIGLTLAILFHSQFILLLGLGIPCMLSCIFESLSLVVLRKDLLLWTK